ncbi:aspartate aminotransferase family protein [Roseiflexus sp.]|uniref:aspartate aminotransferase family protein n=1 Tax=Roseiflexus sp. TaxID=2562120 RepID=UPI0021DBD16A|nr:aspartate aminotransferase family protein [Roseiflexus sp.]GIW01673.1 MAG: glutamate-1-semialdehyde 2,1-aminomutase [Roseiflexus sp.]
MIDWSRSQHLLERARRVLPAGVASNVRAAERPFPLFFTQAEGAILTDVDGNPYIDYVLGQGPLLLGHSHPAVLAAVEQAMRRGQLFAGQHELEIEVAETLVRLIPCAGMCRFGMSGSELVQAAMRLARAVTGRRRILRFEGHYHGWFDNVLLSVAPPPEQAGPRECPRLVPGSAGQTPGVQEDALVLPWNDLTLAERLFAEHGREIAAVLTEPMMCNTGAIPPTPGFLEGLRRLCDQYGVLLIMDEVITGFRLGLSGAQGRFGVTPDLAVFAKAMGGGFAVAALVGRRDYMERFARDVNHSGTFNGNVVSMAAAAAALAELERDNGAVYRHIEALGTMLMDGIRALAHRRDLPVLVQGFPAAFHVAFTELSAIREYRDYALHCDKERYGRFKVALLQRGVRVLDRGIWYLSAAHTQEQIEQTLDAVDAALAEVQTL